MRFWVSWVQPTSDYRPLTDPPVEAVLGWWCSGRRGADDAALICAVVEAEDEEGVHTSVQQSWPEAVEWRFIEQKSPEFMPGDRFPMQFGRERERFGL